MEMPESQKFGISASAHAVRGQSPRSQCGWHRIIQQEKFQIYDKED